jgi:hypothetical protein
MIKSVATSLAQGTQIRKYLAQCRVRNAAEDEDSHIPPTAEEVVELFAYLKDYGIQPAIIGSTALLRHMGDDIDIKKDFRPTADLDIFVNRAPPKQLPDGWRVDTEAVGVPSWISPSGGYVDFLQGGHEYPSGRKNPKTIEIDNTSTDFPVGSLKTMFRLKLNSERMKDLLDLVALSRKTGIPGDLGALNRQQKENLEQVKTWVQYKPSGNYGT